MRGGVTVCLMAILSSPVAVAQEPSASPTYRDKVVISPAQGVKRSASAGEAIIEKQGIILASGAKLIDRATNPAKVSNLFDIPAGGEVRQEETRTAFKACWYGDRATVDSPCLIDDDGDGSFDRASSTPMSKAHPLPSPVRYERAEIITGPSSSILNRKILYQGADASALKLSYRELSNDYARPAFNEELSIPLGKEFPQKVAAKGVIITIFKIDGMGLTYQVDSAVGF